MLLRVWLPGIAIALALSTPLAGQTQPTKTPSSTYQVLREARRLFDAKQYRQAEAAIKPALARADTNPGKPAGEAAGLLELLARVYFESGQYTLARPVAERYQLLLDSSTASDQPVAKSARAVNLMLLADIDQQLGQLDQSEKSLRRALTIIVNPSASDPLCGPRLYLSLGHLLKARGQAQEADNAYHEAASLARTAQPSLTKEQLPDAVQLLAESLAAAGDPAGAAKAWEPLLVKFKHDDPERGHVLSEIAKGYQAAGDLEHEKAYLLEALDFEGKLHPGKATPAQADVLDRLATAFRAAGDDIQARKYWPESADMYEALLRVEGATEQDRARRMQHLQSLQLIYQRLGQWGDGARVTKALVEYRQETMLPDDPAIARAKSALGAFLARGENYTAARPILTEAAAYWRKRTPPAPVELASTLNNLSDVERTLGQVRAAQAALEEAAPLYEQFLAPGDIKLAEVEANLASVLAAQGQFKPALDRYQKAVDVCQKQLGQPSPRTDEVLSTTLLNMAMLYKSQRQFRQAADYCSEALNARRRMVSADSQGLLPFYLALASLHLAQYQANQGDPASLADLGQAGTFVQLAEANCAQHNLLKQPAGANVLYLAGVVHFRKQEYAPAQDVWRQCLTIARANGLLSLEAKCLNSLAEAAVKTRSLAEADQLSAEAVSLQDRLQAYPALHFIALMNRAQLLKNQGQRDEAIALVKKAAQLAEAPRAATVGAEAERAEYFSQFAAAFDLLVDWSVEAGNLDEALAYAEAGRNRTFLDQVRAAGVDLRDSLRGTPAERLIDVEAQTLSDYNRAVSEARQLLANDPHSAQVEPLAKRVAQLRDSYAAIQTQIRDASPFYREVLRQGDPGAAAQIREELLRAGPVAMVYYLGQFRSHLLIVTAEAPGIVHVPLVLTPELAAELSLEPGPLTRAAAAHLVNRFLTLVRTEPRSLAQRAIGDQTVTSAKLSMTPQQAVALTEVLLPAQVRLQLGKQAASHVTVVPDGALHQLPLEALYTRANPPEFIFDTFPPIAYAPSAMILAALEQRRDAGAPAAASLLTVGNPHYPASDGVSKRSAAATMLAQYLALGGELSPLPATAQECQRVAGSFRPVAGEQIAMLEDLEASETNVRAQIGGRRYIHLAAHGLVDQQNDNLFGAIALAQPNAESPPKDDDGFLSLYEIHGLPIGGCELAILSACRTNVGPERPLEAGSTLARAFLSAGARRVVSSHWNVDDDSTAELIGDFAGRLALNLETGKSADYAAALHAARRKVRQNPQWSSPYFWAPFVLIGPAK